MQVKAEHVGLHADRAAAQLTHGTGGCKARSAQMGSLQADTAHALIYSSPPPLTEPSVGLLQMTMEPRAQSDLIVSIKAPKRAFFPYVSRRKRTKVNHRGRKSNGERQEKGHKCSDQAVEAKY